MPDALIWYENLKRDDVPLVGGKNSSLGEMISNLDSRGIRVPGGIRTPPVPMTF